MSWEKKKFIDFILLQRGYDLTKEQIELGEYPVVTSTSIMGYHNAYKAKGPGVVTGRSGTIGEVQYVEGAYWPHNTSLYVKDFKGNNPRFVYYFMKNFGTDRAKSGSAVPTLNRNNLSSIDINVPDVDTQQSIVDILYSYDALIENNQKQIKLLEEAAQRLYKEWFVDLLFPGNEGVAIVDGVPEGWKKTNINAVMTFHRGYDLTKDNIVQGKYPVIGSTSIIGYHNQYKINGPGIVTGRSGSLGKYQLIWEDFWPHNTSLYVSDKKGHHVLYLYGMLQTVDFSNLNNGGAIPTLNRNTLSNITVSEAPQVLQDEYVRIAEPYYQAIRKAKQQILCLVEARNRLLPKLMSGEIEV